MTLTREEGRVPRGDDVKSIVAVERAALNLALRGRILKFTLTMRCLRVQRCCFASHVSVT